MTEEGANRSKSDFPDIKREIETLQFNLNEARKQATEAATELGRQIEIVEAVKPFWENISPGMFHGSVSSGAAVLTDWRRQSEGWTQVSHQLNSQIIIASGTAYTFASNTSTMDAMGSRTPRVDPEQIRMITTQTDERQFVEQELRKIDASLVNTYLTIWQYMHLPAFDPARGPLFLMRQVFDHFLEKVAPDGAVMSQPDFVADPALKKRNGKGVTRSHRIQYAAKNRIRDQQSASLVLKSTDTFLQIYEDLNQAHKRGEIQEGPAKDTVRAGGSLLATWLKALK